MTLIVSLEAARILVGPTQVMRQLSEAEGKPVRLMSLELEQRGEKAFYTAFGPEGKFLVDATTGQVTRAPPLPRRVVWVRHGHYFNFAGRWRTTLLVLFAFLAACSTMSGLTLLVLKTLGSKPNEQKDRD